MTFFVPIYPINNFQESDLTKRNQIGEFPIGKMSSKSKDTLICT